MFTVIFALVSAIVCVIVCTAIVLLILAQLSRDRQSRVFALLVANVAIMAFLSSLLQTLGRIDGLGSPKLYMDILCIPAFLLPGLLFAFTRTYFADIGDKSVGSPLVILSYVLQGILTTTIVLTRGWLASVSYLPDGSLALEPFPLRDPINLLANTWLATNSWYALITLVTRSRRHWSIINKQVFVGLLLINLGNVGHALPVVIRYSMGINLFTCGLLLLVYPVLRQRLFDPLTRLNSQLRSRAEQLQVITLVVQRATSYLHLNDLLDAVVKDMRRIFVSSTITVYLTDEDDKLSIAEQVFAKEFSLRGQPQFQLAESAAASQQVTYSPNGRNQTTDYYETQEICVPLTVGNANSAQSKLIGVLSVYRQAQKAYSQDDIEVIQILGNQLAIAIRNAQLFEQVQHASASKTQFISILSHEIRTPLQAIITNVGSMEYYPALYGNVELPEAYREDIATIHRQAQHLVNVINAVLDINKMEAGKFDLNIEAVSTFELLEEVREVGRGLLLDKPEVELRTNYAPDLPIIEADRTRMRQVLINILGNACKFTKHGYIDFQAVPNGKSLKITIADTGTGISEEAQAHLFEPFAQGSRNIAREYGGSGMGLVTAKMLIELHKGDIQLTSAPGVGTTVTISVPLVTKTHSA